MTRAEFCQLMAEAKKESGVQIIDLSFKLRILSSALYRFEAGKNSFSLDKAIEYLQAIGYTIVIEGQRSTKIACTADFAEWLKKVREEKFTLRSLAEAAGVTHSTIRSIENNKIKAGIDIVLKIVDVLNHTIKLEKL